MSQDWLTLGKQLDQPPKIVSEVADRQGGEPEDLERVGNERSRKLPRTQVRIGQTESPWVLRWLVSVER